MVKKCQIGKRLLNLSPRGLINFVTCRNLIGQTRFRLTALGIYLPSGNLPIATAVCKKSASADFFCSQCYWLIFGISFQRRELDDCNFVNTTCCQHKSIILFLLNYNSLDAI